ncbi:hypothetical protein DUNSADRAFT_4244 [Dunaliella salina]|uniref:Encoded protein n=1 Tax=Dunaliella salina TaxID=3046 RepID=A0ABQ7FUV9_DUNSA|nr:hypothetical protein DUNSADRAFT_4244 [Dunaliella salina]|eukprot:KAF5826189.1 hypothetical protein DUNSADRAFT_4244 [Dunaliella salina]
MKWSTLMHDTLPLTVVRPNSGKHVTSKPGKAQGLCYVPALELACACAPPSFYTAAAFPNIVPFNPSQP